MCCRKYGLPKAWLVKDQISTASEYPWTSNMVNRLKNIWNLNRGTFIIFIDHCGGQLNLKKWLWDICKILRLIVKTFTASEKSSVLNGEYLTHSIDLQLSQKQKLLLDFFLHFWNLNKILNTRRHLYHIYWSLSRQSNLKLSLLEICKILRLFLNTFTAYNKNSGVNREYLTHLSQMQLSQKLKTFSEFFSSFLNLD